MRVNHVAAVLMAMTAVVSVRQFAFAQTPAAASLPAPRATLRPVPLAPLDDLEAAVVVQIREAQEKARRALSSATSSRDLADIYGTLAQLYHAYEFFEPAEAAYANAAHLAAGDARWSHLLGYLYTQTGRFEEAAAAFETARRIRPDDQALDVYLGEVHLSVNRLRDAREEFERAAVRFPAAARRGLGEVALRERRYSEAVDHFRAVLERAPQATAVHYSLAMAYRGLGRLADAQSELQQRGAGEVRPADPLIENLASLVRGERAGLMLGRRAYESGRYPDAAAAFASALEAAPESAAAHLGMGMSAAQLGDATRAAMHLRRALGGGAEVDEGVVLHVTVMLADRARFSDAIALADDAHRRFPERVRTSTTLVRLLAAVPDRALRDGVRASALAMEIYERDPSPAHAETVALALAELGRCDEAAMWIARAIAQADRESDSNEATRLRGEASRYARAECRP
jgi:tetratricopeptide (TPR) repeat protein